MEASPPTPLIGGGLAIPPNGMRVLRSLSQELHDAVIAQGFPVERFLFRGANGWVLGVQESSVRYPLTRNEETLRSRKNDHGGRVAKAGEGEDWVEECTIASSRHGLWFTLLRFVGEEKITYRRVTSLERYAEGRVLVRSVPCGNGAHGDEDAQGNEQVNIADLVIGAGGLKSVVRDYVLGTNEEGKLEWYKPYYTYVHLLALLRSFPNPP